jgi:hypothetical protein
LYLIIIDLVVGTRSNLMQIVPNPKLVRFRTYVPYALVIFFMTVYCSAIATNKDRFVSHTVTLVPDPAGVLEHG